MSSVFIPPVTIRKMAKQGISESQVMDVFNNGEQVKLSSGMMWVSKKYSGYEVGISYRRDSRTGQYVITSAKKRERRQGMV